MRNLKRALSLLLSSTMVLGMLVMGSSAASYKDVTSEYNQEAIDVMEAVSVMVGDENGNFNPDQKVTRAQMAVIMANLLDLKVDDFKNAVIPFTDVPEWARPYVAACYADGITSGTSATTYGSNDTVTAAQAGLMMLKALGYFQNAGDFGNDWQLAAIKQASKIDLYDGINAGATTALTRNEVAQLGLNTLEATMVEPDGTSGSIELGDIVIDLGGTKYAEVVSSSSYAKAFADQNDSNETKQTVQLGEKLYDGNLKKQNNDSKDDFGRPASVWSYKNDTIGKYADEADLTYTAEVKSGEIYDDLGLSKNITNDKVTVKVDGETVNSSSDKMPIAEDNETVKFGSKGALTEVYYDDNAGTATVVTVNTYLAQVSADYDKDDKELELDSVDGTTAPTLSGKNAWTLSSDDFSGLEGYAEDDYVLLTVANGKIKSIQAAEVINATVTAYTQGKSVTADGTKYEYNAQYTNVTSNPAYTLKEEYTLVLDQNGYVIFSDAVEADGNYVYVSEFGEEGAVNKSLVADAYFPNGTNEVITVHGDSNLDKDAKAGWYSYTTKSDKYVLTAVKNGIDQTVNTATQITENGKTTVNGESSNTYRANATTVFVLNDDGKVTVYTGIKNVPDVSVKSGEKATMAVVKDGNYVTYVYIDVTDATVKGSSSSSDDRIYILDNSKDVSVDEDDNTYYTYEAIVNGEETTINTTSDSYTVGLYYDVSYDENGYVDDMTQTKDATDDNFKMLWDSNSDQGRKVTYKDGIILIGPATDPKAEIILADDYTIFVVEADGDVSTVTASKLAKDYANDGSLKAAVSVVLDNDGYATEVYCQLAQ